MHEHTNAGERILAVRLVNFVAVMSVRSGLACKALMALNAFPVAMCVCKPRMWLVLLKCLQDRSFRIPPTVCCMCVCVCTLCMHVYVGKKRGRAKQASFNSRSSVQEHRILD